MPAPQDKPSSVPQLIEVKKYPNRRLYDSTRSQHLTHEELYDLVVSGHTVRVTESKSGADITNLVLMQALIERNPEKFAAFPPELVHLMVRASDSMLRGFATNWFSQVMNGMSAVSGMAGAAPATAAAWPFNPLANPLGAVAASAAFPWGVAPAAASAARGSATASTSPGSPADPVADLQARMESLMRELAELRRNQAKG